MITYTGYAQYIIFGRGALDRAGEVVKRLGWRRALLLGTSGSRARGTLARVESALGDGLAATYDRIQPHVPDAEVAELVSLAARHDVDAIIGFGGGSPIGAAKALSMALELASGGAPVGSAAPTAAPLVPVLAIPTTYAGSEMTSTYGMTRLVDGVTRKVTFSDPRVTPKAVIYDPSLTLALGPRETAGTGANALAHCVEALYSITRNPPATAAALAGLRALASALPQLSVSGDDEDAREQALNGAWLAGEALAHVTMGLHHGICHVIGGATGAAHGDVNAVMLPHTMRYNLDATASQLAPAAVALGLTAGATDLETATAATARIAAIIGAAPTPHRLRDLGVTQAMIPDLARLAYESRTVQNNPKPITSAAELETLLRAAW